MNNKFLFFGIIVITLFLVNGVFAKDVAYVVKTAQNPQIISILNEMNYSYDVFTDSQVANANFSNYSVLLIQDSITNKAYLPLASKNLLFINRDYAPLIWTQGTVIAGSSNIFSAKLEQLGTPFTLGMTSITFDAYTTPKPDYYLRVYPAGINSVARSTGASGEYPIVAYSYVNNSRKVFFGFYSIDYWSNDAKKLFKNSLNWTRLGVDGDGDGYYSDIDCNDNDATKWRNLPGYRDVDSDGLGAGNLLQVCSGTNLSLGYVSSNGDCNDNDATKWRNLPGYMDVDRDSIGGGSLLQVCSGNNLANGYSQSGGDCDDSNANVYGLLNGYLDSDLDGRGSGEILQVCSGEELPSGYSNSGMDCNDSDGSVWRLVNGYLDSDDDGFGTGNVLEACSGFNLAPGFSTNNQDCNDLNSSINPNAIEVPYDGMDQTCKGYDLADVDKDGYCNAGYSIQNASLQCAKETGLIGTDCNDEDSSFNPGSSDLLKNCRNEAPALNPMNIIRVKETELVSLIINATDPDGDNLTYFVNDSRFYQDENNTNIFSWQTDYLDVGKYAVEIIVSDGEFNATGNINVEVTRSNRAPICEEIPIIQFNEEENVLIDLNEYCFDDDFDNLTFSIVGNPNLIASMNNGIASLSGVHNYFGEQTVLFKVSDGIDTIDVNVTLDIISINDAPVFNGTIAGVEFNEGSNSTNVINLNEYFNDVDSNLSFNFTGNNNLEVRLHNGYVSFYPLNGFFGTETIIFSAGDEEFTIYSNPVKIDVKDINVPPVFSELNCMLNINEDTLYECQLDASDVENDSFSFSVENKTKMNCSIEGNTLRYISEKDKTGSASCTIKVTDVRNASIDKVLEFDVGNLNDAPNIKDYYPKDTSLRVLTNTEKKFTIFGADIDSDFSVVWRLGNEVVGNLSNYNFIRSNGTYVLTATVSDGEYETNQSWNIFVGNIQDFTCSEMNGHVCNENQTCGGQILNVFDTTACCNIACSAKPPEFKNIKNITVENKTSLIGINSLNPESSEKKYLGDEINSSVRIENSMADTMDFDIQIYIYDVTKEKVISRITDDAEINDGSSKIINFSYTLPEDLKEEDSYYIFIRAIGKNSDKDKFYNQIYEKLNVDRKDSDLVITDVVIEPLSGIVCGDEISAKVLVENLGKNYQYITLKAENPDLDLNIVSESFRVGNYKEESEETMTLSIPSDAKEGVYKIKISFGDYDNNQVFEKEITLEQCANQINTLKSIETIKINPSTNEVIASNKENNLIAIIAGVLSIAIMIAILIVLSFYMKNIEFSEGNYNEFGILDVTPIDTTPVKTKRKAKK